MGRSASWLTNVAPAAYAVAGLMIVAGIYLVDPALADLGFGARAERTAFAGAFLIFAGMVLALSTASPALTTGNTLVDLSVLLLLKLMHFTLAAIQLIVGAHALFADPGNVWAALLLIPGAIAAVILFADNGGKSEKETGADGEPTASDSGKIDVAASARVSVLYGAFFAVSMGGVMIWLAAAMWAYYRLTGTLLQGETLDLAAAGDSLSAAMQTAWPMALGLSVICAVITAGGRFAPALIAWFTNRGTPDANRDLANEEIGFIISATAATQAYAKAQGYDRNKWLIQTFSFLCVMAAIGIGAGLMFNTVPAFETPGGPSFPIERRSTFSPIVFFFACIFLAALPNAVITRLSRRYAERMGWVTIADKDELHALNRHLTGLVRARRLSSNATFHPGDVLETASRPFERFFLTAGAALMVLGLFVFHRDANAVDRLTANEIEFTDYWTLKQNRFAYTDVRQVVIRCFFSSKGEALESYELHLPGGRTLGLYKNADSFKAQIGAYEAIDAKLTAAGIPFVPGAHKGMTKGHERGYGTACVDQVARAFPADLQERVRAFFHVKTLAAAATIWPWNADLAKAAQAGDDYRVGEAVALYSKEIESAQLTRHLMAVAYAGRARARKDYETAHGVRDAPLLLALADYQKSLDIEPTLDAYRGQAGAYIALGAYDEARAAYRQALKIDKPPHWSLIGLARVERIRGNTDAAMKHLDEALAVWGEDKASMPIFFHRARVLYLKGDDAGVIDAIGKGLRFQPDYPDAFRYRACAHARRGAFGAALQDIESAIAHAAARPIDEAWEKTPYAKNYHEAQARDHARIKAMAAGKTTEDDRTQLCGPIPNESENPRPRSPLLPAK